MTVGVKPHAKTHARLCTYAHTYAAAVHGGYEGGAVPFLEYIITLFMCSPKLLRGRIGIRPTGDVDSINMLTPCIIMDMILFAHCHHSFLFIICVLPVGAGYCNNNRAYSPLNTSTPFWKPTVNLQAKLPTNYITRSPRTPAAGSPT